MSKSDRGFIGDMIALAIGWVGSLALVVTFLFSVVASEDSLLFNCHISGNMVCGEGAVWHGFVNWSVEDR
jgi:hypothetical protein